MGQENGGNWGQPLPPGNWHEAPPGGWNDPRSSAGRLRPMTIADVLDGMFRMFLAHWRTYVLALGAVLLPLDFLLALLGSLAGANVGLFEQFADPTTAQAAFQNGPELVALITYLAIAALSAVFVTPFVTGVACRIAAHAFGGGDPQPLSVLRETLPRYWALVGVMLLLGLMGLGVVAAPAALLAAGVVTQATGLAVFGGILLFAAVLVLTWLVTRLQLAFAVIVVERVGPVTALRRSWQLVRGRWWRVFGTMLLAGLVSGIVAQVASFPFALPGQLFGAALGVVFLTIGTVISGIITTPLSANAQTLLYFDGRIRNEAYDLEVMTQGVAGSADLPPPTGPAFG